MESIPSLSTGSLTQIIQNNVMIDKPIVQILGSKQMANNNNIRLVLTDGKQITHHCIVVNNNKQSEDFLKSGVLDKYSVIRLEKYCVLPNTNNDVPILFVNECTLLCNGSKIGRKLESNYSEKVLTTINQINPQNNESFTSNNNNNNNKMGTNGERSGSAINRENVCSINAITPYFNSFIIRARVTSKTQIRNYNNSKGDGKFFSFDVTDDSSEIRITAFNKECDKFYDIIEKDFVYYIQRGSVRNANKKYSNLKNEYEIQLNNESLIELCNESISLPKLKYKFIAIKQLVNANNGSNVDVIGVIRSVSELESGLSKKNSKQFTKREITLLDKSCAEIRLTLWGKEAQDFSGSVGSVLAVKNVLVGDFKGKVLSCVQNSSVELDPDLSEAHLLKGWYDREGHNSSEITLMSKTSDANTSNTFRYLCEPNLQSIADSTVLYYNCKATIVSTNRPQNHLYKSCGLNGCLKKVRDESNGYYHCDKCGNHSTTFQWRLMLSFCVSDCTSEMWFTAFQEVAEKIVGVSTTELSQMFESYPNQYQSVIAGLNFKTFNFRVGSKVDEYNNEKRVKSVCYSATQLDPIERSKKMIQNLKMWTK